MTSNWHKYLVKGQTHTVLDGIGYDHYYNNQWNQLFMDRNMSSPFGTVMAFRIFKIADTTLEMCEDFIYETDIA